MTQNNLPTNNKLQNAAVFNKMLNNQKSRMTAVSFNSQKKILLDAANSREEMKEKIKDELLKRKKAKRTVRIYSSSYAYIYEESLRGAKYEKEIREIENRLADLGISGKIHRLSQFKNLEEIVEEDARRGIETIVVLGGNDILRQAIATVSKFDMVLGAIPLGKKTDIAKFLGIPEGIEACNTLSQRFIEHIDIGKINNFIFFSNIYIPEQKIPLFCDKKYEVLSPGGSLYIYNLNLDLSNKEIPKINPKDGKLEILVQPKPAYKLFGKQEKPKPSLFYCKKAEMESSVAFLAYIDGKKQVIKKADIKVLPKKLKMVVGRNRKI